ncbi:MAG: 50S ribosomal protein L25 [Candidatus Omnitrophica bacterium]|nr:50S ribosomal protein L25 [Candidatus Omnitrophota bacterium]MBU0897112.1 50S ribosomal protein L25 [Candidatus Omnitrophota bacterium]MBU1134701.1 50S ribosomal protein L25 [Candidatus Omnitrophota bacterium]MBU1811324.1 50S ribosomal protein L25 [Candidatus Omnitrophota bacterium]MBU2504592.1 50S ribosomal protein L25 [Candidatus Omnitrophota bacterium]
MERIKLTANFREKTGKKETKKIKREGSIPAICYGKDINIPIILTHSTLKILRSIHFSESTIIDMEIVDSAKCLNEAKGAKEKKVFAVLIKDLQVHPLSEEITHIDFMKVSLDAAIIVKVPLSLKGEAKGVKEGGVLEQILWELEIEGLPLDVPQNLEVDICHLEVGHSLHVGDIKIADNLKIITSSKEPFVTVTAKLEEVEETGEALAQEPESKEPEVIKEKKDKKGEKEER